MRHRLALFIVLALVGSAVFTAEVMADTLQELEEPLPNILVERDIKIKNAGIVLISDTLTLRKPPPVEEGVNKSYPSGELVFGDFWVGFHESFIDERRSFEVWQTDRWIPATYSEESEGEFCGYRIVLPAPVTLRDSVDLRIRASYLFVNMVSSKVDRYEARIPVYPALVYNISSFAFHAELPPQAQFLDVISPLNFTESAPEEETWVLDHESEGIGPLSNINALIQYAPSLEDEYLLDCQRLERQILIRQSDLRVADSYALVNTGDSINRFHLELPSNAADVRARDGVGLLEVSTIEALEGNGSVDSYVTPRSSFRTSDRWVFTISYSMPKEEYLRKEGRSSTLTYPVYGFPYYIRELSALVTLPEGGRLLASQPESSSTEKIYSRTEIRIALGARLPSEQPEIEVEMSLSPLAPYLRTIALLVLVAGALGSVYFLRRRRVAEVEPTVVERPRLSEFLEQQRERISLLRELDDLQKELEEGDISRDRFDGRVAEINRRRNELASSLRQLGKGLEAEDPGLRSGLVRIRSAEQELDRINNDLRNLEVRLRARRITKREYERRRLDRLNRRGQAMRRIERALASLAE